MAWLVTSLGDVAFSSIEPKVNDIGRRGTESGWRGAKDSARSVGLSFSLHDPSLPTGALTSSLALIRSATKFPETGTQATGPATLDGALDAVRSVRTIAAKNARVMIMLLGHACLLGVASVLGMVGSLVHLCHLLDTQIFLLCPENALPFLALGARTGGLWFLSSCIHWSLCSHWTGKGADSDGCHWLWQAPWASV